MHSAEVAIVTRTKSRPVLLERAIESILGQGYDDWVHVIVNDGGDQDELETTLREFKTQYKGRLTTIHNDPSKGMEAASNIGVKATKSKYLVIHDDDDSWSPHFLAKTVSHLTKNKLPTVKGVITHSQRIIETIENGKIRTLSREPFNNWLNSVTLYRIAASNPFPPISFLFERSVWKELGGFREDLPVLGDWEFHLRFASKYDIDVIKEELAFYHHRPHLADGVDANSIFGWGGKHEFYDALLRNEMLRKDLQTGRIGLGYLVNIARSFELVHGQVSFIERAAGRIKSSRFVRAAAKLLRI